MLGTKPSVLGLQRRRDLVHACSGALSTSCVAQRADQHPVGRQLTPAVPHSVNPPMRGERAERASMLARAAFPDS
ncbi:hypothetical protein Trydic_g11466 [Trypoxylus dichotomus]